MNAIEDLLSQAPEQYYVGRTKSTYADGLEVQLTATMGQVRLIKEQLAAMQTIVDVAKKVLDYRKGKGAYNFSHLQGQAKEEVACDVWQNIEHELEEALKALE